ncbi:hypothetical protein HK407_02g03150 [Ordospora pajunii]|uniref:uncharacterized protein n=1 Tax=Ordospora pajunii TaxID=3039483 RepID=UPI0029526F03|nr:uncharacterized protein HK407_02g03150 [Ordospora pajunii]KAH9412091.1 hypothetical protein HK407_02g03150 [Ordospora pajunii]
MRCRLFVEIAVLHNIVMANRMLNLFGSRDDAVGIISDVEKTAGDLKDSVDELGNNVTHFTSIKDDSRKEDLQHIKARLNQIETERDEKEIDKDNQRIVLQKKIRSIVKELGTIANRLIEYKNSLGASDTMNEDNLDDELNLLKDKLNKLMNEQGNQDEDKDEDEGYLTDAEQEGVEEEAEAVKSDNISSSNGSRRGNGNGKSSESRSRSKRKNRSRHRSKSINPEQINDKDYGTNSELSSKNKV